MNTNKTFEKSKKRTKSIGIATIALVSILLAVCLTAAPAMADRDFWVSDSDIISGLGDVGSRSAPTMFCMDGTWYLISGEWGGFHGFNWTGSTWQSDPAIVSGLGGGNFLVPTVFNKDGTWYLISGEASGQFTGYKWTDSAWVSDSDIISGLGDVGDRSAPTVFCMDGTWYLIAGGYGGGFSGYKWTGSAWESDPAIVSGLRVRWEASPTVFCMDGTWYLISGSSWADITEFYGFKWTGSAWESDPTLISGLTVGGYGYPKPTVFHRDQGWYLIYGQAGGTFCGFKHIVASDFTPTAIIAPPLFENQPGTITAIIANIGVVDASSFTVALVANRAVVDVKTVPSLSVGASTNVNFEWTPASAGAYRLCVVADPDDAVFEMEEKNNEKCITVAVGSIIWQYDAVMPWDAERLSNNNTLITEYGNHTVLEVTPLTKKIIYGTGTADSGPGQLNSPIDAERLSDGNTLITDSKNHRVIEVDSDKNIVWQYGNGTHGAGINQLSYPMDAERLPNGNTLITDDHNCRIIELRTSDYDTAKPDNNFTADSIVWQYGTTGVSGSGPNELNYPKDANRLPNGNTLIADYRNHRVVEVNATGGIVWQYGTGSPDESGSGTNELYNPTDAERLSNGNTLIADYGNHRVIEVRTSDYDPSEANNGFTATSILWQYESIYPPDAERLSSGNTLICEAGNHRVIEVGIPTCWDDTFDDETKIVEKQYALVHDSDIVIDVDNVPAVWRSTPSLVSGLGSGHYDLASTIAFNITGDGRWILFKEAYRSAYTGAYYWDGSQWTSDSSLLSGLPNFNRAGIAFNITGDGRWNMIMEAVECPDFCNFWLDGYYWDGSQSQWVRDTSLLTGLDFSKWSTPAIAFNITGDERWDMIYGSSGYYWNGSQWIKDPSLVAGCGSGDAVAFNVTGDGRWNLFSGTSGYYWTGSQWIYDSSIGAGLSGYRPAIAFNVTGDGKWNIINVRSCPYKWYAFNGFSYPFPEQGSIISDTISQVQSFKNWAVFNANDTVPAGTKITYKILDASNNTIMSVVDGRDISSITEESIRLYAELTTDDFSKTPVLHDWSVCWETGDVDLLPTMIETPSLLIANVTSTISTTIANHGNAHSGNFKVTLSADDAEVDSKFIEDLPAGGSTNVLFEWTPTKAGYHTLAVIADSDGAITETNETNNELRKEVVVLPRIIPVNVTIKPETLDITEGGEFTAYITFSGYININSDVNSETIVCEDAPALRWDIITATELIVTFNISDLRADLPVDAIEMTMTGNLMNYLVEMTVTGELTTGQVFEGSDVVRVLQMDIAPPYTAGHNPVPGATNITTDTNITVHIKDNGSGVDVTTISMKVNRKSVEPVITGNKHDYKLTYDPLTDFGFGEVVDVTIDAADLASNEMSDAYSFTTGWPDLAVTVIDVYHNKTFYPKENYPPYFNLSNEVDVTVTNIGTAHAAGSSVSLYIDSEFIDKLPVPSLDAGASATVQFKWAPIGYDCEDGGTNVTYTLKAIADCDKGINEMDETNNELTAEETAYWAGYSADEELVEASHGVIRGGLLYTTGDGGYVGLYTHGSYKDTHYNIELPADATVKHARLNVYYTWSRTEVYPVMEVSIDGTVVPLAASYNDRPCESPAIAFEYPWGNYVYDLTPYITGSGSYTVTVKNSGTSDNPSSFCPAAPGLVILYEDSSMPEYEYWILEGADVVEGGRRGGAGYLSLEECTNDAVFPRSIDLSNVSSATVGMVSIWGGEAWGEWSSHYWFNDNYLGDGRILDGYFELYDKTIGGVSMYVGASKCAQVGANVSDVTDYIVSNDNVVTFGDNGDSMMPSNAFLLVERCRAEKPEPAVLVPFMISGYVFNYSDETPLNIKNMNTGEPFTVETRNNYSYYQVLTSLAKVSCGDVLRFTCDGTSVEHRVRQSEIDAGGFEQNVTCTEGEIPPEAIPAGVTFDKKKLDLNSSGILKAFITLPDDYDVAQINVSTVRCEEAKAFEGGGIIPGKQALEVKFKIPEMRKDLPTGDAVRITVTGELYDGTLFEGSNTLKVVCSGKTPM